MKGKMKKIKHALKSVRVKLFLMLSLVILLIIIFLILVNNFVFGQFYLYSKTKDLEKVYIAINEYYNNSNKIDINSELEKIAVRNNFDILIKNDENINVFTSNKDFLSTFGEMNAIRNIKNNGQLIEQNNNFVIKKLKDNKTGVSYILSLVLSFIAISKLLFISIFSSSSSKLILLSELL